MSIMDVGVEVDAWLNAAGLNELAEHSCLWGRGRRR